LFDEEKEREINDQQQRVSKDLKREEVVGDNDRSASEKQQ